MTNDLQKRRDRAARAVSAEPENSPGLRERSRLAGSRKRSQWRDVRKAWQLYVLLAMPVGYAIVFLYWPLFGLQLAFRDFSPVQGVWGSPWVGLENVTRFVTSYQFWDILRNTIILNFYELLALFPMPIVLAILLNTVRSSRFRRTVQTITYAPHFISTVVVVGMLVMLFSPNGGIVNQALGVAGVGPIDFQSADMFRHTFVWSGAWQTMGYSAIIFLAALAGIDPQLHDAAKVDGASLIRRIWHIDLPGILPVTVTLLILNMGSILSTGFEKVLLLQTPFNLEVSEVIDTYAYRVAFVSAIPQYSFGTAVELFKSVICLALLLSANWLAGRVAKERLF